MVQSDIADDELAEVVISDKDCGETVEVDNWDWEGDVLASETGGVLLIYCSECREPFGRTLTGMSHVSRSNSCAMAKSSWVMQFIDVHLK